MSGVLSKIMPTRAASEPPKLISDLDLLDPKPMAFRFKGRVFQIQVGTVRKLAQMSDRLDQVLSLLQKKARGDRISDDLLYKSYHRYLSVLCPDLTESIIQEMTVPQLKALLTEIIRYAVGQQSETPAEEDPEKKKTIA